MIMEITLLIMEKSWKNHGILFLNFCGKPETATCWKSHALAQLLSYREFLEAYIQQSSKYVEEEVDELLKESLQGIVRQLEGR